MILNICTNSNVLTVFYYVKIGATIISIVVPILLMYKLIKILSKHIFNGEPLTKDMNSIAKTIIAALVVFLVPTIANGFFKLVDNYSDQEVVDCYLEANLENIKSLREKEKKELQERMEKQAMEAKKAAEEQARKRAEENAQKKKKNEENQEESSNNESSENALKQQLTNYLSSQQGTWSVYVINTKNNNIVDINGSQQMVAASTIKLFIMEYLYSLAANNQTSTNQFENLVSPMIKNSDNDATNQLIDKYGMSNINNYIKSHYSNSTLQRKMLTSGNENYTSASDLAKLLKNIHDKKLINQNYSERMLNFLKGQTRRSKIPAGVPSGVTVANKTGENTGIQNDAAIVYSANGDYILVVLGNGVSSEGSGVSCIKEVSSIVYKYYNN